jgi:phosphatidylinositol alpha-1,6-mannosyltransferase
LSRREAVVLVTNNFPPVRGGSAIVYHNLAQCSGGKIIVIAPKINYLDGLPLIGWREHDRRSPYRIVRLPLLRTVLDSPAKGLFAKLRFILSDVTIRLRVLAALAGLIVKHRVRAICIGELIASAWIIQLFGLLPWIRVLVYVHGEEITTADPYDVSLQRRRHALLAADRIIVVSRFTLDAVKGLLCAPDDGRISLIQNGVDLTRFQPHGKKLELSALYDLEGCFVFVSVCRLLEKKGIDAALKAFARTVEAYPDCRFLIVGSGPYAPALRALTETLAISGKVRFTGEVPEDELVEHYCLGDVFVMPNRKLPNGDTEGFGLVFLEANGCGLPVIAGRDGGSTDAVSDGVNGLVVDGNSIEEIAAAMMALRRDADLRGALGRKGLAVAGNAGWDHKAEAFLAICTEDSGSAAPSRSRAA